MALVPPPRKTAVQIYLHFEGKGGWTPVSWTTFWRHKSWEKRQKYSFALEPADKQVNSQVLVLGFSQAPPSTSCMPQPFPALQPAVPARKYLHHRV